MLQGGSFYLGFDVEGQLAHLLGPGLLVLIHEKLEFAQVVGITQSVLAVIAGEVGLPIPQGCQPMIMQRLPPKDGQKGMRAIQCWPRATSSTGLQPAGRSRRGAPPVRECVVAGSLPGWAQSDPPPPHWHPRSRLVLAYGRRNLLATHRYVPTG